MHTLARQIRFQIDPFGRTEIVGCNSYAGRPVTEGVGLYLALWVHLRSELNAQTGFVVNVSQIDAAVRRVLLPRVQTCFRMWYRLQAPPELNQLFELLNQAKELLSEVFEGKQTLIKLDMELSPFRRVAISWEKRKMMIYTEKFEFAAMHKLWNDSVDTKTNFEWFGKCANPAGHGHNYILEVSVCPPRQKKGWLAGFEKAVKDYYVELVDHKNLNIDVTEFARINPTVENLARLAWKSLKNRLKPCKLVEITVWENDRTYCKYSE